tara:strand:- start:638 stop:1927 length:1290 start_codon:yes stop_codon:yes gene_type:complete
MKFDVEFQTGLLALMTKDKRFLSYAVAHIKPSFFATKDLGWVFNQIRSYYKDHRTTLTKRVIQYKVKEQLRNKKIKKERVDSIREVWDSVEKDTSSDREFLVAECVKFVEDELVIAAFSKAKEAYDKGEYNTIPSLFQSAIYESSYQTRVGQFYPDVENLKARVIRRVHHGSTCPFGISEVDNYLRNGGLGNKEMGVILAPPNRGKSMALKHIAEHNVLLGKKVALFTLEMSEDRYLDRFDMSLAEMTSADLVTRADKVEEVIGRLQSKFDRGLHIKEYGSKKAAVQTLVSYVENLRAQDWYPDLIVVDYADELSASTNFSEERHNIAHIYKELRGWAVEDEVALWTASQANRASLAKKVVTIADIAEDFSKAAIADVIIALCQTSKEYDEQKMRAFLAKNRDNPAKLEIPFNTNFYWGRLYSDIEINV